MEKEAFAEEATCPQSTEVCCQEENVRKTPDSSTFGEWPHTCLIFKKGTRKQIGGASMLTPKSVITAAHKLEYVLSNNFKVFIHDGNACTDPGQTNILKKVELRKRRTFEGRHFAKY